MSRTRSIVLGAIVAILALASGILLSRIVFAPDEAPRALATGTLLSPGRPLPAFTLIDHTGAAFDPSRLQRRWTLMFFGFTTCPDVCPTTLALLARVEQALSDLPAPTRPQVVLVSVDPERDVPEQLANYVHFFSPSFVGVTGSPAQIDEFTRAMGTPVAKRPLSEGGYTVDHSGSIFVVDPSGALRALFSPPHSQDALVADLRVLLTSEGR